MMRCRLGAKPRNSEKQVETEVEGTVAEVGSRAEATKATAGMGKRGQSRATVVS